MNLGNFGVLLIFIFIPLIQNDSKFEKKINEKETI